MNEIWLDIKDYEGLYQASNFGRVRSLDRIVSYERYGEIVYKKQKGQILKPYISNDGYYIVRLCKNKVSTPFLVHRLVAETFIPNPENKPCTNHLDEVKTNNRVDNLNWMTYKENSNWGTGVERQVQKRINGKRSKVVERTSPDGNIDVWPSTRECERKTGIPSSMISRWCNGSNDISGHKWRYIKQIDQSNKEKAKEN